jgi:hypothetical protein
MKNQIFAARNDDLINCLSAEKSALSAGKQAINSRP